MIRRAKIQEIPEIMELSRACASHMIEQGIYQWNEHYPSAAAFENDIDRNELYVLELNGELVGTITITPHMDDEYKSVQWLNKEGNEIYIHRLAVHPHHQGKGCAQQLMSYAEDLARNEKYNSVRLDTFSKNFRNQRFYTKRGYVKLEDIYFPKQSEYPFHCYELVL